MNYSLEQLRDAYAKLPENIKEAVDSVDSIDIMLGLRKKYSLTIEQMGYIADETGFAMLGLTHPKDFVGNIKNKLGVEENVAQEITKEINENIFNPIKESLMELHSGKSTNYNQRPAINVESMDDSYREPVEVVSSVVNHESEVVNNVRDKTNAQTTQSETATTKDEPVPSKEELLKEIERNPASTIFKEVGVEKSKDFISKKLSSNTNIPSKETVHEIKNSNKNPNYSDEDPYRESVI